MLSHLNTVGLYKYEVYKIERYKDRYKHWCTPCMKKSGTCDAYETFLKAKIKCNLDDNCGMIYERIGTNSFTLCELSARIHSSDDLKGNYILYLKLQGTVNIVFQFLSYLSE